MQMAASTCRKDRQEEIKQKNNQEDTIEPRFYQRAP
jgi:hypothetical protein